MTKRRTTSGERVAEDHTTETQGHFVDRSERQESIDFEQLVRTNSVRKIFELCSEVIRSIQIPVTFEIVGSHDLSTLYKQYANSDKSFLRTKYGLAHYMIDERQPRREKDLILMPVVEGQMFSVVQDVVQKESGEYMPAGLLAFDYIISTSNFRRFPIGNYIFTGATILNNMGEWCLLQVSIGERHGLATTKIIEPFLVPLVHDVPKGTHIVLVKK